MPPSVEVLPNHGKARIADVMFGLRTAHLNLGRRLGPQCWDGRGTGQVARPSYWLLEYYVSNHSDFCLLMSIVQAS
eukprot:1540803-Pleurochrysis_carterae.AAC.1